jgi:hypothetical protein
MTRTPRGAPSAAYLVAVSLVAGCVRAPESAPPDPPSIAAAGLPQCTIVPSQLRPLIVEWTGADRGSLELRLKSGPVVVRYEGCSLELLPECTPAGTYTYAGFTRKRDHVAILSSDDLFTQLPVGAARLEGTLARAGALQIDMTLVGQYRSDLRDPRTDQLTGRCDGATHMISAAQVGAFALYTSATRELAATGAQSVDGHEVLTADGVPAACEAASAADLVPPDGCAALLRIELTPIRAGTVEPPPVASADLPSTPPPTPDTPPLASADLPSTAPDTAPLASADLPSTSPSTPATPPVPPPPASGDSLTSISAIDLPPGTSYRWSRESEPPDPAAKLKRRYRAMLGVGYAALPVGLGTLIAAVVSQARVDRAEKQLADPTLTAAERESLLDDKRSAQVAFAANLSISLVFSLTSLTLQVLGHVTKERYHRLSRVQVGPMLGRGTGGLSLGLRF